MEISSQLERILSLTFSSEIKARIDRELLITNFSKGKILLREGEQSKHVHIILQGIVRGYYIDRDGNDITKCLASEGGFFATEGLRSDEPATFTIECLEAGRSIQIPYVWLRQLLAEQPMINHKLREMFQEEVAVQEQRSRNLLLLTAEERYIDFCETFPELVERIPLRCIASYIGIHFGSLSRIRNNLNLT
ncbi:Crp/Fnr family transcriptional regulator [Enterococcus pallens]|uniref:Cyclic nucleotide-binding domain-containing protein n=1 Tax=Enterococcus pallens ATCC BAA-351 TaxID=1158607 RepID=R2SGQ1_9ENTE|nr:Crp/Fnr family transcriptional regulator [Enterococcus pallens]EOH94455.1 hypothetical protein UAU_02190 [Enterococcus pallens ATCC BAA-351]EOU24334.1 hypothetical protein I588_00321 [Enterococcus pallens ATCC BAA-351]OJG81884.1 hypothetical protein RV10_GL001748 [Enterococcus pallens]